MRETRDKNRVNQAMTSWEGGEEAFWNFIRNVAGRNNIPAEEVERDIEKAIRAVRKALRESGFVTECVPSHDSVNGVA